MTKRVERASARKRGPRPYARKYESAPREIYRVYRLICHWLYRRGDVAAARQLCGTFEALLDERPVSNTAFFRHFELAVLREAQGDIERAIAHRWKAIKLIRAGFVHVQRTRDDVLRASLIRLLRSQARESFKHLDRLYRASGRVAAAKQASKESARVLEELKYKRTP